MGGKEFITGDGSIRRSDRPLNRVPTPHFLRRFLYEHQGDVHVFDESHTSMRFVSTEPEGSDRNAIALVPPTSNKRTSQVMGPAPKRREIDELGNEFPAMATQGTSNAQLSPFDTTPDQDDRQSTPQSNNHLSFLPQHENTVSEAVQNATQPTTVSAMAVESQPTLLSPTASPRSPDMETSEADSPPPNLFGGPPSARAYAPNDNLPVSPRGLEASAFSNSAIGSNALDININGEGAGAFGYSNEDLARSLRQIGEGFASIPPPLHKYTIYSLLRGCNRQTLSALFNEVEHALHMDILGNLPPELSKLVLCNLDFKSAVNASHVCRGWYNLIDHDEDVWYSLIQREKLPLEPQDITLAKLERWGYSGWSTLFNRGKAPVNAFGAPANPFKAVFRRLDIIRQNWSRADLAPRRMVIQSPDKEVITCLSYSDDVIIASTDATHHLNVFDTRKGTLLHSFNNHGGGVWALKRVGTDMLVTGSIDHTVRVWSLSKNRCTHVFRGHTATVRCLDVVDPDPANGRNYPVILSGSRDATVRMFRLPGPDDPDYDSVSALNDYENPYFLAELRGHTDSVRALCGAGNVAVTGSYDHRVRVWDIARRRCRHELLGHEKNVYAVNLDTERNRCISASMDFNIKIWDLESGSELYNLSGHTGLVGLLELRDNTLVSGGADYTLRVWDPETGQHRHTLTGHDSPILCLDHDGHNIVSGSIRDLKLWNAQTGKFVRDLLKGVDHIWQVKFDRKRCVAAVARGQSSHLEILDFDFDPVEREQELKRQKIQATLRADIDHLKTNCNDVNELKQALIIAHPEYREYLQSESFNEILETEVIQSDAHRITPLEQDDAEMLDMPRGLLAIQQGQGSSPRNSIEPPERN